MSGSIGLRLFDLLSDPGNGVCADCGCRVPPPRWASASLGIFLCVNCVGIHRGLGVNFSITKSMDLDKWTEDMYQFMSTMGNIKSNEKWTKNVPVCWKRPTPLDHDLDFYVEEWVRAKYERREFLDESEANRPYCTGEKNGLLHKRERRSKKWNQRYFKLSAQTCSLSYHSKATDVTPIRSIDLKMVNVMLCSEKKTDKFFSMQISYPEQNEKNKKANGLIRNIYVHAETGKEIVDWYLTIRAARFKVLALGHSDKNVSQILSKDYIKEGPLKKSGPRDSDRYQLRWVAVEDNKFSYFEDRLDSTAKHEVKLRNNAELYCVSEGVDGKHPEEAHPFMVQTPERVYNFSAETREEMEEWIQAFHNAILSEPRQVGPERLSVISAVTRMSVSSSDSAGST